MRREAEDGLPHCVLLKCRHTQDLWQGFRYIRGVRLPTMGISKEEAYDVLEVPLGADPDSVRTSYKRLALKWHPDKHSNSPEATRKFQEISVAYKRLTDHEYDSEDDMEMTMDDMFELFTQIFFVRTFGAYNNGYGHYDSSDDEDEDYDDDDEDVDYINLLSDKINTKHDLKKPKTDLSDFTARKTRLTLAEIEKNANELITEEEKEKRKAEKRKAKKKRRREKKKLEKVEQQKKNKDASGSDEEDFDTSAAFFHTVINKKKKSGVIPEPQTTKTKKEKNVSGKGEEEVDELEPKVLRSRQLAIRGNEMANVGEYSAAIDLFTEAIKLDPRDFRFFGNRSYCFDRIQQYEKALRDADKAISLQPDWPKGYFRKGRALAGLKLNVEAEQAFMQVLKLDRNCDDAMQELLRVRTFQLTEMGFSKQQAESAIRQHNGSVQQALDSLLAGVVGENSLAGEVYISDDDEVPIVTHKPLPKKIGPVDAKMDPANPEGLTALWVGNVLPEVTEKKLTQMFSKYGTVTSVRCLPEKYCAFINYKSKEAAGRAIGGLQGVECGGQRLLIKFPDNPISNGNVVIRKNGATSQPTKRKQPQKQQRYKKF